MYAAAAPMSGTRPLLHYLSLLRLPGLPIRKNSSKHRHRLQIHLRRHRLIRLRQLTQKLKIINIKTRGAREENSRFLVRRIAECVRRADRHDHVVACFCVDDFFVRALDGGIRGVWDVEAHGAGGDVEGLVVHFVPVWWGAGGLRGHDEFCDAEAVVCVVDVSVGVAFVRDWRSGAGGGWEGESEPVGREVRWGGFGG